MNLRSLRLMPSEITENEFHRQGLKHTVISGSFSLVLAQGIGFVISMISTIVLARLLTPADFGLMGMVNVFIYFLVMFKDAGLSTATIQKDVIDKQQMSSLFWINGLISIVLGLVILISAPLIAMFYKKPELTAVTAALSVSFMIQGFVIQHNALLQRHLKFTTLAINDIIAHLVMLFVSIGMAVFGFNYWSLVGGALARTITLVLLTFISCPWFPGKFTRGTGIRSMLKFGVHLTGSNVVGYFARNLDGLLIGKFLGAASLGLYSKSFSLLMTPLTQVRAPLTTMSLPVLSALKNEPERYRNYFQKLLDISISLSLPITIYCFLESKFIIHSLLGQQWMAAEPVFKLLSIAGVFVATSGAPGLVMLSHGYSKRYLHLSIVTSLIICAGFIGGIFFNITGVAIGYSFASFLIMIPLFYYGIQGTHVTLKLVIDSIKGPVFAAFVSGLITFLFIVFFSDESVWHHILTALIFFISYVGITLFRQKTRETAFAIYKTILSKGKVELDRN